MKTNKKMIAGIVAMSSIASTAQVAAVHAEKVTVQPEEVKVEEKQTEDNSQAKPQATQESVIQDAAQLKETVDQQTTNVSQKQKEYDQSAQNKAQAQESVNVALTHKEQELSKALDDLNAKKDALSKAQKELADINNQIDQNQKDLLAAQKEKEQAEAALKAAETVKKEDVEKAKADVDAKSQEESRAKTALNNANNNKKQAEEEKNSAAIESSKAQQQYVDAYNSSSDAKKKLNEATQQKDDAQKLSDSYKNGTQKQVADEAQKAVEDAKKAQESADAKASEEAQKASQKANDVNAANKALDQLQNDETNKNNEIKQAEDNLSNKKNTASSQDAEKAKADNNYADAQKKTAEAQVDVNAKQKAYDDALDKVAEKKQKAEELRKQVQAKQEEINKIQKQMDNAQNQYSKGFIGFAEWAGDEAAAHSYNTEATVFETNKDGSDPYPDAGQDEHREPIRKYTHDGQQGDASSIENLKNGIVIMKEINRVRRSEGLNDMKVSLPAVAAAILHTNWSAYHGDHAGFHGYNGPGGNENLAWGYGTDPVWGWFYVEKMVASAQGKLKLSDEDYNHIISITDDTVNTKKDVDTWAKELAKENPETGHYGNIILGRRPDAIGAAAYNNDPKGSYYGDTSGMEITSDYSGSLDGFIYDETDYKNGHYDGDGKSPVSLGKMSLEDYEKLLNQYLDTLDTKKLAQQIDALKAEKQSLEQQADDLLKGTAAEKEKKSLDEAKTALENAKNAEEAAKKDAEAKAAEAESAHQAVTDAENVLAQKKSERTKIEESISQAKKNLDDAKKAKEEQDAVSVQAASDAKKAAEKLNAAKEKLANVTKGQKAADDALAAAIEKLNNAKTAYDKAQKAAQDAAEKAEKAAQYFTSKNFNFIQANEKLNDATTAYTIARNNLDDAKKQYDILDKALNKKEQLEKEVEDNKKLVDNLTSSLEKLNNAVKDNKVDSLKKVVDKADAEYKKALNGEASDYASLSKAVADVKDTASKLDEAKKMQKLNEEALAVAKSELESAKKAFDDVMDKIIGDISIVREDKHNATVADENVEIEAKSYEDAIRKSFDRDDVLARLSRGETVDGRLIHSDDASMEDVDVLQAYAKAHSIVPIDYFALGVETSVGNVSLLPQAITYTMHVKAVDGRTYHVVRLHDDVLEDLPVEVNGDEISFTSDKYSAFMLGYSVAKKDTGTNVNASTKTSTKNMNAKSVKTSTTAKATKNKVVQTGDSVAMEGWMITLIVSAGVLSMLRKRKENS